MMVLNEKGTTVTYRCPECGTWVTSLVGVFSLTADMLRLKCPCGGSEMTLLNGKDKKVRLTVPCFLCPQPHSFALSTQLFFDKDLFALPCAYSGIDICFLGKEQAVNEATKQSDQELEELLGEAGYAEFTAAREKSDTEIFSDLQILDIIHFVVRDLQEAGEISCKCEGGTSDYTVEVTHDGVRVQCKKCGASTIIPVTSTLSANAFLHCEHLELV
ncbi:MAG: hypothetical protein HFE66_02935 [Clostridiales bacterium]|jgi:DNA-directed RNA polymerase subunit RPC12/RpoP|nr:hypothetical protein [Clostridiales bacterium]